MDPGTGKLYEVVEAKTGQRREVTAGEARQKGMVPVVRDLRPHERTRMQIALYSPCGCGSGKKFKFCCFRRTAAQPLDAVVTTVTVTASEVAK